MNQPTPPPSDAIAKAFIECAADWQTRGGRDFADEVYLRAREIAAQHGEGDPPVAQVRSSSEGPHGVLYAGLIPAGPKTPEVKEGDLLYLHPPHVADDLDGERLDYMQANPGQFSSGTGRNKKPWFHAQGFGYFSLIRDAIDAAIAARAEAGGSK